MQIVVEGIREPVVSLRWYDAFGTMQAASQLHESCFGLPKPKWFYSIHDQGTCLNWDPASEEPEDVSRT